MAKRSRSTSKKVQVKTNNSSVHGYDAHDAKNFGWILIILGLLFLFSDLGFINWWNINWWSILLLIFGIKMIRK